MRSGRYLWNGGMFVWRASRSSRSSAGRLPASTRRSRRTSTDGAAPGAADRKSVDYAVMEKLAG